MTRNLDWLRRSFSYFGLAGSVQLSVCILLAAFSYTGLKGEPFSLFNHFISELGEVGVSRSAWLFNGGMIAAGFLFLFFCLGLGLTIGNTWARLGLLAGVVASISCAAVGVFPMNHLAPHVTAALTYFRSGLVTILLFGVAIWRQSQDQESVDRRANLAGLAAVACYAAFLFYTTTRGPGSFDPGLLAERPAVWISAVLEWLVFFSTVVWFFAIALAVRRPTTAREERKWPQEAGRTAR
jgi:hypothetical membrane protein